MRTSGWRALVAGLGLWLGTCVGASLAQAQASAIPGSAEALKSRVAVLAMLPGGTVVSGSTFGVVLWDARPVQLSQPAASQEEASQKGPIWQVTARPGGVMLPDAVTAFSLLGNTLVVSHGPAGITLLDVSDPTRLLTLSQLQLPGAALDTLGDSRGLLWVALGSLGVACVDISDLSAPRLLGTIPTGGYVRHLAMHPQFSALSAPSGSREARLLVAAGREGLLDLSVGPHLELVEKRVLAQGADIKRLLPYGDGLVYSQGAKGLCYMALSGSDASKSACLASADVVRDLQAWGTRILAADGGAGVMVADFSTPLAPKDLGHLRSAKFTANRLMLLDDLLFVAADASGVLAIPLMTLPGISQSNPQ